ncbi:MAG: L,D-transpeptidase family protein [Myxococcota bacterium]
MRWRTLAFFAAVAFGCSGESSEGTAETPAPLPEGLSAAERAAAELDRDFPKHGVVTGLQLRIRSGANPDAAVVGWLRTSARVRLAGPEGSCEGGRWYRVHPTGFVCGKADELAVGDTPPEVEEPTEYGWHDTPTQAEQAAARGAVVLPPGPRRDDALPYDYFFVKERAVPEYHRLPSRNEQRAAAAKGERFLSLLADDERRARAYLDGADDGPPGTAVTHRYLNRGFYVASTGAELRARRRFVRSTQGRYVKASRLEKRTGSAFTGVELSGEVGLPVAWALRPATLLRAEESEDGSVSFVADEELPRVERQDRLLGWKGTRNVGGSVYHVIETEAGERFLRSWWATLAEPVERPAEVGAEEPWVHVDLGSQTLVLYEGDAPRYATLVSTGTEGFETPTGLFEIRRKHVTDTMSNIGDGADDAYRIEDVPWTQYFEGSFALHAAFWHGRFGTARSHGCVNLAPADAHRVFSHTWPTLPEGWHGAATEDTGLSASHVLVTE